MKVNGIPNNLWYANDTVIVTKNIRQLQTTLNSIKKVEKEYGEH